MITKEYYKDLTKCNTFGMKVKAKAFVEYDSVADLVELDLEGLPRPILHIGAGSNLLFTEDFKGTVLHSAIKFIEPLSEEGSDDSVKVSVGSGVIFDDFCAWAASNGLWGTENLSNIPGETGAAAVQNIGAYGVEVKDIIDTVYCYDLEEEEFVHFDVQECGYGYRDSVFKGTSFKGRYIVTHVVFRLNRKPEPKLDYGYLEDSVRNFAKGGEISPQVVRDAVISIRKEKLPDPAVLGSAGSFFKNPVVDKEVFKKICAVAVSEFGQETLVPHYVVGDCYKVPAAWLIEKCGWKGKRAGGAAVYEKQPLVIVNFTGDAYPEEIVGLEKRIVSSVEAKFGIRLSPEVEHI